VGQRNHALDESSRFSREWVILWLSGPLKSIGSRCYCALRSQKINNGDSGTAAATCNAPDWAVSHYIVPLNNPTLAMQLFVKILWSLISARVAQPLLKISWRYWYHLMGLLILLRSTLTIIYMAIAKNNIPFYFLLF